MTLSYPITTLSLGALHNVPTKHIKYVCAVLNWYQKGLAQHKLFGIWVVRAAQGRCGGLTSGLDIWGFSRLGLNFTSMLGPNSNSKKKHYLNADTTFSTVHQFELYQREKPILKLPMMKFCGWVFCASITACLINLPTVKQTALNPSLPVIAWRPWMIAYLCQICSFFSLFEREV